MVDARSRALLGAGLLAGAGGLLVVYGAMRGDSTVVVAGAVLCATAGTVAAVQSAR